jgi:type I protein arginine methyltransferase
MYSLTAFGKMIADALRTDSYVRALRETIKPGSVVVDLGCGPALFALMACELGARRVFAIDPNDAIQVGRDAAHEYGFSDRIEFIQEMSTKITLPEQVDVIVSDLHGVLPWFGQLVPSIVDARERFLAPGGVLIPARDHVWLTIVEVPDDYEQIVKPWNQNGFTLNAARNIAVNTWRKMRVRPENFLSEPIRFFELDYATVTDPSFNVLVDSPITKRGTAHGFVLWFDAEMIDGIGFTNAPGDEELIYGQAFFPFQQPVEVDAGDRVDVRIEARLVADDYVWRWETTVASKQISFKQSTLAGTPLSLSQLRKRANTYLPQENEAGAIARFVLSQMDGTNSIQEIATKLAQEFQYRENEAFDLVAEMSEKYST